LAIFRSELRHIGAGKFWGEEAARVSQSSFAANADHYRPLSISSANSTAPVSNC
jgi:hypothetical protein